MAKKASDILKNIGQGIYNFLADIGYMTRPIGIIGANYDFIYRTLSRNIGNGFHEYDGYGTPIGSLADINYNLRTIPWFLTDTNKNRYSNYFNYIRGVYNPTSNLSPIDGFNTVQFGEYDDKLKQWSDGVGVVNNFDIIGGLNGNIVTNSNLNNSDTSLGVMNGFILAATLDNAAHVNTIHSNLKEGITKDLYTEIGLKDNNITTILNTTTNIGNVDIDSPLDSNNFGKYGTIGTYYEFYNASTQTTKNFIEKSLVGADLMTAPDYRGGKQKYQANIFFPSNDYLSKVSSVGLDTNVSGESIRYKTNLDWNNNAIYNARILYEYLEQGNGESGVFPPTDYNPNFSSKTFNEGINYGTYTGFITTNTNTLIGKTNLNFKHGKYRTLISRFHTDVPEDAYLENEMQSAISHQYGMSMGRNLLKKDHINSKTNGYSNPYCRVWTYHHQYNRIADMIRPFVDMDSSGGTVSVVKQADLDSEFNWNRFRSSSKKFDRDKNEYIDQFPSGGARLGAMGSKNEINGFVNITPTSVGNGDGKFNAVKVQNCMFSIENLAWKGMRGETFDDGLSDEQKGPFGGRIMWFPPYDISFSENVSVNWSPTSFIGRGENIYTYVNTERSGQLHFKLLIDHPAILNYWKGEHTHTKGALLPDGVDDVDSDEQTLLRFFAGCEILRPMKTKTLEPKPIDPKPEPKPNPVPVEKRSIDKSFSFFVFYPNNYSGVDDKPNGLVSGMEYLINGVGAQKYEREARENEVKTKKYYEDLPSTNADIKFGGKTIGGYEMRLNDGISTVKTEAVPPNRIINTVNVGGSPVKITTILNATTNKQWYYRVDNRVSKEILRKGNYVDADSFGLNSELGYKELLEYYGSKVKEDSLYSFSSVFIALTDDFKTTISDSSLYNAEKVKELQYILNTYKIKEVNAMGVASSHGYTSSNNILNKNRAQSVVNWLKSKEIFSKQQDIDYKVKVTEIGNVGAAKSVSDKVPKMYRAAQIEIVYQVDELVNIQDTVSETFSEEGKTKVFENYQDNYLTGIITPKLSLMPPSYQPNFSVGDADYSKNNLTRQIPRDLFQNGGIESMTALNGILPPKLGVVEEKIDQVNHRYDNESEFFSLLGTKDPFLHNKLVDKIKYFDPAFHSITPEGFNSRLTFLHQCTRQGSTVGASSVDKSGRNANNLAFGRPPICILRIGDFYYTKIIIDSMSINYDPLVWDLNTEGIGVQPMIADIDISFKFIGGSDLAGPIARLQNALSFNYYSNTGVYDNRSEMVKYDEDGEKIIDFKAYK